ncbi:hypothetical protein ABK040_009872 [Willaertia magna]
MLLHSTFLTATPTFTSPTTNKIERNSLKNRNNNTLHKTNNVDKINYLGMENTNIKPTTKNVVKTPQKGNRLIDKNNYSPNVNDVITPHKDILRDIKTPTPFRKHFSGDIEKYKLHLARNDNEQISPFRALEDNDCCFENQFMSPTPKNFNDSCLSDIPTFVNNHLTIENIQDKQMEEIQTLKTLSCEYLHNGLLDYAIQKGKECHKKIVNYFGKDHIDNIYIKILLGEAYTHRGNFTEAKKSLLKARNYIEKNYIKEIKNYTSRECALYAMQCYSDLGYLMRLQGKFKTAIDMYQKTLNLKLIYYEKYTHEVASAYNQLGVVFTAVGNFDKALEYLNIAKDIREIVLGTNHNDTATVYNNLGNVYLYLGQYLKALNQYKLGKVIMERNNLVDHPDFATALVNMATCLKGLNQFEESIILYEKALDLREKILGIQHSSTIACYVMIGNLYLCTNNTLKAEEYILHATKRREELLGEDHVDTAMCYIAMGHVKTKLKEFVKALEYFEKVKKIFVTNYGEKHPETLAIDENISNVLLMIGRTNEALELMKKIAQYKTNFHGGYHPSTATIYNNIGNVLRLQGRIDEAFSMYQKARTIYESVYGFDHVSTAITYTNLGHLYYTSYLMNSNDSKIIQSLTTLKMVESAGSSIILESQNTPITEAKLNEALKFYTQAKSIRERLLGINHLDTITSYRNLALVYSALKNYRVAYRHVSECKHLLEVYHHEQVEEVKETSKVLAEILRQSGGKVKKLSQSNKKK